MKFHALFTSVLPFLISSVAFASLGKDASSIQDDAKNFGGQSQVTQHSQYSSYEISRGWGKIHEFADANGKIFALAWQGKKHPELQSLLADHLSDFQRAISQARKYHHHGGALSATVGNLHVEMGGHMGALYGNVWLTDQIPSGMDVNDIK